MSRKDDLIRLADRLGEVQNLHGIENVENFVGLNPKEGAKLTEFLRDCEELLQLAMDMDCQLTGDSTEEVSG